MDEEAVRKSLVLLLTTAGSVVRMQESATLFHFVHWPLAAAPGIGKGLAADLRMPEMSGAELLKRLNDIGSLVPAVVITGNRYVPLAEPLDGGWISVTVACAMALIMTTWVMGTKYLFEKTRKSEMPLDQLASILAEKPPSLVVGTAIFLTSDPQSAPAAMMHSLKHYKVLHEQNIILTVVTAELPEIDEADRVAIEPVNELLTRVTMTFGYMEQPNIPRALLLSKNLD